MGMSDAIVALGGNLGDVIACFRQARAALGSLPDTRLTAVSLLYRTPPLGPAGQPDYLNAAIKLATRLAPEALLDAMQAIETAHGRDRSGPRWGPRTLDLDLIAHHDAVMDTPSLTLPHPRMHERLFVLEPVCDIWPEWRHPRLQRTACELRDALLAAGAQPLPPGRPW